MKGTELNRLDQTQNTAVRGSRQRTLPNKVSRTACGERIYFEISGQNQPCPPALVKKDAAQQREAASHRSDPRRGKELLDIGEHDDLLQL